MNKYTELVDNYFSGEMDSLERKEFERQLETNMELRSEFDYHAQVLQGLEYFAIKSELYGGFRRKERRMRNYRWLTGGIAVVTLLVFIAYIAKKEHLHDANSVAGNVSSKTVPLKMTVTQPLDSSAEDRKGIVEAAEPHQLLPTAQANVYNEENKSGSQFVWSKAKGKNLPQKVAAEPLAASMGNSPEAKALPLQNAVEKTAVFGSNRLPDGKVDWANLGTLDHAIADSSDSKSYFWNLQDSGKNEASAIKDKKLADSIYRSFRQSAAAKTYFDQDTTGLVLLAIVENPVKPATGAALFRKNCASCHSLGTKTLKGPGMEGLMSRIPKGDWLFNYILNSQRMISSGNVYANKVYEKHGRKAMTVFEGVLSESEIRSIIDFIGRFPAADAPGGSR